MLLNAASGFFVSSRGDICTNAHIVTHNPDYNLLHRLFRETNNEPDKVILVRTKEGRRFEAEVVAMDEQSDIGRRSFCSCSLWVYQPSVVLIIKPLLLLFVT